MAQRFNISLPNNLVAEHAELIKKVSLSKLLQDAIRREAQKPETSLPVFIGEAI